MIVLRNKLFSTKEERRKREEEKRKDRNAKLVSGGALGAGGLVLGGTQLNKLTGKEVRYHNTARENVDSILREGIKTKFAEDPENLTNRCLRDVPMDKKRGLIYVGKNKNVCKGVENGRRWHTGRKGKTLKLVFDYDKDIKNKKHIPNPELRGATSPAEFAENLLKTQGDNRRWADLNPIEKYQAKWGFETLGDKGTDIFDHDISPDHIVGGKGYKKRTLKDVVRYAKNNPKRFGKEAAKVAAGTALVAGGAYGLYRHHKNKKKREEEYNGTER